MRKTSNGLLLVLMYIFLPALANAAVINFTESSGNLDFPNELLVGTTDIGTNTVSGSLAGNCTVGDCNFFPGPSGSGNSQDSFHLTVASGTEITGIFVTTSNVFGPSGFTASFQLESEIFVPLLPLNSTTGNLVTSALGPATWRSSVFGQGASEVGEFSLDYQINYVVTSVVPLPAAAWLFGSALLGLGALKRKKA